VFEDIKEALEEIAESISVRFFRALRIIVVASVGRDAADEVFEGSWRLFTVESLVVSVE
jgi:hypothetical protein